MLWRKMWYETRTRFLLSAVVIAGVCAIIIVLQDGPRRHGAVIMSFTSYVWNSIYKDYVRNLFAILVIVLGGGTLLQERAQGTVGFTLALPLSRYRLLATRWGVGIAEVACLAAVPVIVIPALSTLVGEHYSTSDALAFGVLWLTGGSLLLSAALLISSIIANEYAAWMAAFLSLIGYEAIVNFTALSRYPGLDVLRLMNGSAMSDFDPSRHVIAGGLSWLAIIATLAVSAVLWLATTHITRRRDY